MSIEGLSRLKKFPTPRHIKSMKRGGDGAGKVGEVLLVNPKVAIDYVLGVMTADPNISNAQLKGQKEKVEEKGTELAKKDCRAFDDTET